MTAKPRSKDIYVKAHPKSYGALYVQAGAVYRVVLRDIKRLEYRPDGKMFERKEPWADFYNQKGQYIWDCNRTFLRAHFAEVPPPNKGEFKKTRAKPTRAQKVAMDALTEVMRQLQILKMEADRLRAELGLSEPKEKNDIVRKSNPYRHIAQELLALLCGDGGHYAEKHGLDAAMKHGLERFWADKKALDKLRYFASNEADRDCEYGDNCPSNAGSRHYQCTRCKALEALDGHLGE